MIHHPLNCHRRQHGPDHRRSGRRRPLVVEHINVVKVKRVSVCLLLNYPVGHFKVLARRLRVWEAVLVVSSQWGVQLSTCCGRVRGESVRPRTLPTVPGGMPMRRGTLRRYAR